MSGNGQPDERDREQTPLPLALDVPGGAKLMELQRRIDRRTGLAQA